MSEVQPQPGDKVRVTSVVDKNGRYGGSMSIEDGLFGATLEIMERAADPSRDPVGTIRGDRYIRLADYNHERPELEPLTVPCACEGFRFWYADMQAKIEHPAEDGER